MGKHWTDEEKQRLLDFIKHETPVEVISEQLGFSRQKILYKIKHLGYALKPLNKIQGIQEYFYDKNTRVRSKAIRKLRRQNKILTKKIEELLHSVKELGLTE